MLSLPRVLQGQEHPQWQSPGCVPFQATLGYSPAAGARVAGGRSWAAGATPHPSLRDTAAPLGLRCRHQCRMLAGLGDTGSGTRRREKEAGWEGAWSEGRSGGGDPESGKEL